ncbi:hypothetical protein [Panacagrimonas perspica]|uniref:hypothetical protein n=1 Tax=Panacagrimonas perspica TaxID=381431 RepID=UPI0013C2E60C|nr:hypothetical protein [Panacagrimonas perspica]
MNALEWRAVIGLGLVYALRMVHGHGLGPDTSSSGKTLGIRPDVRGGHFATPALAGGLE